MVRPEEMAWVTERARAQVTEQAQVQARAPERARAQELMAVAKSSQAPRSLDSRYHHNP